MASGVGVTYELELLKIKMQSNGFNQCKKKLKN